MIDATASPEPSYCAAHAAHCVEHLAPILSSTPDGFPILHALLAILTTIHYAL